MKIITAATKLVLLLGMPLSQSISPRLHNETYSAMNLDYFYLPVELPQAERLPALLAGLRLLNLGGLAITKPYKVGILPYLDELDASAQMTGSCNTVYVENGRWIGYNTDGLGALRSLREETRHDLRHLRFVSLGAGGAGRSTCFELAKAGAASITLTDINNSCHQLAAEINRHFPGLAEGLFADDPALKAKVKEADILLNMSGLGMSPHQDETPLPKEWLQSRHICFDAIYAPAKTRFLREAEQRGCQIINGLGMCLYQGSAQIELWTGLQHAEKYMRQALQGILAGDANN